MKNLSNRTNPFDLTANRFLENVMSQIKINQKTFPLNGIGLSRENVAKSYISATASSDRSEVGRY